MGMAGAVVGAVGLGTQLMGMGAQADAARKQAQAQQAQAQYGASVADQNAAIADYQAGITKQIGAQQEQTSYLNTAATTSAQRTSMAANGIDLGQGTATDILVSTALKGNADVMAIRDNTARKAWAYETQAAQDRQSAAFQRATGNAISPDKAVMGSLLGSASSFANSLNTYGKNNWGW